MSPTHTRIRRMLCALRSSVPDAVEVYTRGGCFALYEILRAVFPQAIAWYDGVEGHVITEIDGAYWDINGRVALPPGAYRLCEDRCIAEQAHRWRYRGRAA